MGKKRRCANCGRMFVPKGAGDVFCSSLCKTTGKFVGGGGDTTKPLNEEQRKALEKKRAKGLLPPSPKVVELPPRKIRNGNLKYPRVVEMFSLPLEKRWETAKGFTPEEREFSRRMMRRMLSAEKKLDAVMDWDGENGMESLGCYDGIVGGSLGESDDGSI